MRSVRVIPSAIPAEDKVRRDAVFPLIERSVPIVWRRGDHLALSRCAAFFDCEVDHSAESCAREQNQPINPDLVGERAYLLDSTPRLRCCFLDHWAEFHPFTINPWRAVANA
jgi:hypothetical protein